MYGEKVDAENTKTLLIQTVLRKIKFCRILKSKLILAVVLKCSAVTTQERN